MDDSRGKRGYALSGLMCVGTLACGPEQPSGDGGTETTGYSMMTESSSESGSETESEGLDPSGGSETDTETETETDDTDTEPDCYSRGDICGEFTVCQCSCDWSADCCSCEPTTCTLDAHCPEGDVCDLFVESHHVYSMCVPPECVGAGSIYAEGPDADLGEFSEDVCARDLTILYTTMITDLTQLASLEAVVGQTMISGNTGLTSLDGLALRQTRVLEIQNNENLTNIDALTSLESVDEGLIYCNPQLPMAHIEAVLAQIPGGDQVTVADNGNGPC